VSDLREAGSDQSGTPAVQLLTPEGERVEHPDYAFAGDDEMIRGFYAQMALVRRVDAEAIALQRQGELGLWPSSLGQEGAQIGAAYALRSQDFVFPTYREHGVTITRGVDPLRVLAMYRGCETGTWDVFDHKTYMSSIIIGSQGVQAAGYGMGLERDGLVGSGDPERDAAVVCFFGDGASSQGDINEGLIFAASFNAPVVFFCSNNQWAISEPSERQSRAPLYRRAAGFGFPGVRVDGNDALAVHAVTTAALDRARSGNGPTFIEAYTYRMGAHTTSDDPTKYRLADELEHWRARDPLSRVRAYLERSGAADAAFFETVDADADALAAQLRRDCLTLPVPTLADTFDWVYAEESPELAEQLARHEAYAASFEEAR
jgi:2-oxoisovalerate dehydrogenase E1 component alpha subunit